MDTVKIGADAWRRLQAIVRADREWFAISRPQLAAVVGCSKQAVEHFEMGEPPKTLTETDCAILEALEWPTGWAEAILLGHEDGPPTQTGRLIGRFSKQTSAPKVEGLLVQLLRGDDPRMIAEDNTLEELVELMARLGAIVAEKRALGTQQAGRRATARRSKRP